jgi:hypothetical protein
MELVKRGQMILKAASRELKIRYRQGKRIYAAYLKEGDRSLIHGNTGRPSNNRTAEAIREAALEAYRNRYGDFGPTFAAEQLAAVDGIGIGVSTLRRLLLQEGLGERKRRGREYRSRRERWECFWKLIPFDESHHRWFEERGPVMPHLEKSNFRPWVPFRRKGTERRRLPAMRGWPC